MYIFDEIFLLCIREVSPYHLISGLLLNKFSCNVQSFLLNSWLRLGHVFRNYLVAINQNNIFFIFFLWINEKTLTYIDNFLKTINLSKLKLGTSPIKRHPKLSEAKNNPGNHHKQRLGSCMLYQFSVNLSQIRVELQRLALFSNCKILPTY